MMFMMGMISAVKMVLNVYNDRLFVDLNTSATYNQERTTLVPKLLPTTWLTWTSSIVVVVVVYKSDPGR